MPLPNMASSPNQKNGKHWSSTNTVKNQDKAIGTYTALSQLKDITFSPTDKLSCELIFYRGDKRHVDWLNLCASYKAMEDGIFIALNCDDSQIKYVHVIKSYDKHNPRLIVKLTKIEGDN
jgi:crossover junction endodeoxyribonuclease RusA